ncbi:hypothetical protein TeGR_g6029, partial [Tetraparma gracilis]
MPSDPSSPLPPAAAVTFARTLLSLSEYERCHSVLSSSSSPLASLPPAGRFLRWYSRFLAGEKRKEEEIVELSDPAERCRVANPYLPSLCAELAGAHAGDDLDHAGLYMYGVVLKERLQQQASLAGGKDGEGGGGGG